MVAFISGQVRGNLMRLRAMRGLSPGQLAKASGLTISRIRAFESGKADIDCAGLYVLAQALEVPIASMYEGLAAPTSPDGTGLDIDPIAMLELFKMLKSFSALAAPQQDMVRDYIDALLENSGGSARKN